MKCRNSKEPQRIRPANLRQLEAEADLKLAQDLLGFDHSPDNSLDRESCPPTLVYFGSNPLFPPRTMRNFDRLRETLVHIIDQSSQRDEYPAFIRNLIIQLVADLPFKNIRITGSLMVRLSD